MERVRARRAGSGSSDSESVVATAARDRGEWRRRFVVRNPGGLQLIPADDVDWLDVASNYVRLHVSGRIHFFRRTIAAVADELDASRFVRVHRGYIVNVDRIVKATPRGHGEYELRMRDGALIPVSRTYADRLRALLE